MALFQNKQWEVTEWGLECRKPEPPYEIDAKRLAEKTERAGVGYYDWPVHMAEKTWVDIEAFIEAFSAALKAHAGKYGDPMDEKMLQASFALARKESRKL